MEELRPEDRQILERYGFDAALFQDLRKRWLDGSLSPESGLEKGKIEPPPKEALIPFPKRDSEEWKRAHEKGRQEIARGKLGIVILNGGMATRFGGVVKGTVPVTGDLSFLGLKIRHTAQVARECGGKIPILLMNSWATDEATLRHLEEKNWFDLPREDYFIFHQYLHPRLDKNGNLFKDEKGAASFYGPGHGDFAPAIRTRGGLDWLRARGVEHILVANVDNLGARVDPVVLGIHLEQKVEATVEVAPKWPGDKGGCPVLVDGKIQIVEDFRFPPDFDQDQVEVFNCNTFTFELEALDREFPLSWFAVRKRAGKEEVIQFERLIGQLTAFLKCAYLVVPRTGRDNRFYPVKTPKDLEEGREVIRLLYPDLVQEREVPP